MDADGEFDAAEGGFDGLEEAEVAVMQEGEGPGHENADLAAWKGLRESRGRRHYLYIEAGTRLRNGKRRI